MAPRRRPASWTVFPLFSYWTKDRSGREHSVNIRPTHGEYMVIVAKGTMANHQHGTQRFQKSILGAMKIAEKLVGRGGRWTFASGLEFLPSKQPRGVAVCANVIRMTDGFMLSAIATPAKKGNDPRATTDAVLAEHAHDVTMHKTVHAAIKAAPAALRRVTYRARCACTEVGA